MQSKILYLRKKKNVIKLLSEEVYNLYSSLEQLNEVIKWADQEVCLESRKCLQIFGCKTSVEDTPWRM